jgi:hypothetical protein
MSFKMSLAARQSMSRYRRQRYASDPEFRLYYANASRAQRGLPPYRSAAEIPTRSEAMRAAVRNRARDGGRFA